MEQNVFGCRKDKRLDSFLLFSYLCAESNEGYKDIVFDIKKAKKTQTIVLPQKPYLSKY